MPLTIPRKTETLIESQIHNEVKSGTFKYRVLGKHGIERTYKVVISDGKVVSCHRASLLSFIIGRLSYTHKGDTTVALARYLDKKLGNIPSEINCNAGQLNIGQVGQTDHAGVSLQTKGSLVSKEGVTTPCIVKKINNKNELVMQMQACCDPKGTDKRVYDFMPKVMAVLDSSHRDLLPELEELNSIEQRSQFLESKTNLMMVMEDVSVSYPDETPRSSLIDLKFSSKLLHHSRAEELRHGYPDKSKWKLSFRLFMKSFSKMPFAYSKISGKSPRRIGEIRSTGKVFKKELSQLNSTELERFKTELCQLRDAVKQSPTIAADASLLLVPTESEDSTKRLHVKIIDFAHGLHESENIKNFYSMRSEAVRSIDFLINMISK